MYDIFTQTSYGVYYPIFIPLVLQIYWNETRVDVKNCFDETRKLVNSIVIEKRNTNFRTWANHNQNTRYLA